MPVVPFRGGRPELTQKIVAWLDGLPLETLKEVAKAVSLTVTDEHRARLLDLWLTLHSCPVDFCEGLLIELRRQQQSASHRQQSTG